MEKKIMERQVLPLLQEIFPIETEYHKFYFMDQPIYKEPEENIWVKNDVLWVRVCLIKWESKNCSEKNILDVWQEELSLLKRHHFDDFERVKNYLIAWADVVYKILLHSHEYFHRHFGGLLSRDLARYRTQHPLDLVKPRSIDDFKKCLMVTSRLGRYFKGAPNQNNSGDGKGIIHENVVSFNLFRMLRTLEEIGRKVSPAGKIRLELLDLTKDKKEY